MFLWIANLVSFFSPQTRLFHLRRWFYRLAGVTVADTAKICGTTRIHYKNAQIGADTWLGAGTEVISTDRGGVTIGNNCDIGPGVMFVTGSHQSGTNKRRAGTGTSEPIHIGDGTWVGARATFIAGATLGKGCMVAAGSVVRGTFPDNSLVAGVPAKAVRRFPEDSPLS